MCLYLSFILSFLSLVYLDPPFNVFLDHNGEPGQLQVSWKSTAPKYFEDDMMFMIRYSSKSLGQKIKEVHVPQCLGVEHQHSK